MAADGQIDSTTIEVIPNATATDRLCAWRYLTRRKAYDIIAILGLETESKTNATDTARS